MDKNTFLTLSNSDVQLYYTSAFFRIKKTGDTKWQWRRINSAAPFDKKKGAEPCFKFISDSPEKEVWPILETDIDFKIPKSQIYNYKDRIVYVTKTGNRTQRKGINSDTVDFNCVLAHMVPKIIPSEVWGRNPFILCESGLDTLFEKITPIPFPKTILSILKGNAFGRNLDGRFWLSAGIFSKKPTVWMRDRPIAELETDKQKVIPHIDLYEAELNTIFSKHGYSL